MLLAQIEDEKKRLLVSDYKSHSVMEVDELGLEFNVIVSPSMIQ